VVSLAIHPALACNGKSSDIWIALLSKIVRTIIVIDKNILLHRNQHSLQALLVREQ
jgi:hypothetical protein